MSADVVPFPVTGIPVPDAQAAARRAARTTPEKTQRRRQGALRGWEKRHAALAARDADLAALDRMPLIELCQECARRDAEANEATKQTEHMHFKAADRLCDAADKRYWAAFDRMVDRTPGTLAEFVAQLGALRREWARWQDDCSLSRQTFRVLGYAERFAEPPPAAG